jgi:cobalt transporter subunit CbtA
VPLTWPLSGALSLRGLLLPAFAAGLAAGLAAGALQQMFLVPLILQAESIEVAAGTDHSNAWEPQAGLERIIYGLAFNCLGAVGFALLLTACYALRGPVTWRQGLIWGLGGYVSFALAPALGLMPELPGAHAADLGARQLWWILTAVATAGGLACVIFLRGWGPTLLGGAALVLPHLIGAPEPVEADTSMLQQLARSFAFGSLAISLVLWLMLGALTAVLVKRQGKSSGARR